MMVIYRHIMMVYDNSTQLWTITIFKWAIYHNLSQFNTFITVKLPGISQFGWTTGWWKKAEVSQIFQDERAKDFKMLLVSGRPAEMDILGHELVFLVLYIVITCYYILFALLLLLLFFFLLLVFYYLFKIVWG